MTPVTPVVAGGRLPRGAGLGYQRAMTRSILVGVCACLVMTLPLGCARRLGGPGSEKPAIEGLAVPLDVQKFQIAPTEGRRGVFLRLSRLPYGVEHRSASNPARIIIDVAGPAGEEGPEEVIPGDEVVVNELRILRQYGSLRITLGLPGSEPPEYSVHRMADWIMIRIDGGKSKEDPGDGLPPA